ARRRRSGRGAGRGTAAWIGEIAAGFARRGRSVRRKRESRSAAIAVLELNDLQKLFDAGDSTNFDVDVNLGRVRARDDHALEAEGGGFARAGVGLRHAAHLA